MSTVEFGSASIFTGTGFAYVSARSVCKVAKYLVCQLFSNTFDEITLCACHLETIFRTIQSESYRPLKKPWCCKNMHCSVLFQIDKNYGYIINNKLLAKMIYVV
jgi:hypothetical protein